MAAYNYLAVDRAGRDRKGSIEAETAELAREQLKADGLMVLSVGEQSLLTRDLNISIGGKPKPRDMSIFCRQFVSIIEAGVTVIDALDMLSVQTENKILKNAIAESKSAVEKGESLGNAMRLNRKVFSDMFITMVEAGEASGSLDISFTRMAVQFEKDARLKSLIKKASIYPAVVAVVAVVVVIARLPFVVPPFEQMFDELGTELPAITKFIVTLRGVMQKWWYLVVAGIVLLVAGLRFFRKSEAGRRVFGSSDEAAAFGKLTVKTACSPVAHALDASGRGLPSSTRWRSPPTR
jgi:type IV pilus assembly protein PilC